MRHPAIVGAALDLVSALAASEGLALVGVPVFGVWGAPTEAHDLPAFWASRVIARAEGARQFVLLSIKPPTDGHAKGKRAVVRSLSAGWGEFVAIAHSFLGRDYQTTPGRRPSGLTSVVPLLTYTLPVNQGAAAKAPETSAPRRRPLLSQAQGVRHA